MKGSLTGEPGVPVVRSTALKNCDCVEAIHRKLLLRPGELTSSVLLTTGRPLPKTPIWLTGASLQVPGWQMALMAVALGKVEVTCPAALTAIS